jgi:hypothetical protein
MVLSTCTSTAFMKDRRGGWLAGCISGANTRRPDSLQSCQPTPSDLLSSAGIAGHVPLPIPCDMMSELGMSFPLASSQRRVFRCSIHTCEPLGRATIMSVGRLTGLLLLVVWLGVPLRAGTTVPVVSCSSVFIESLQEYRTTCSNGSYYTTWYRPLFKDWETRQMFPSGPRKPIPLYQQPRPGARQY